MGGDTGAKLVDLLLSVVPKLSRVAVLVTIQHRLPSIFGNRGYVEAGGLMSYAQKISDKYLQ